MAAAAAAQELVLASTSADVGSASATALFALGNGACVHSFRAPASMSSTTTSARGAAGAASEAQQDGLTRQPLASVCTRRSDGFGALVIATGAKQGRAGGLPVWSFQKEQQMHRLIPPVRVAALAASHNGQFLACGTFDGRVFLWNLQSGRLLLTVDAHYRAITSLAFSSDDVVLVSGSDDASLTVWTLGSLMDATPMRPPAPYATLQDHTLAVTDLKIGFGRFPACRVYSVSQDCSLKVWTLESPGAPLLTTFALGTSPLSRLALDPLERYAFVSSGNSVHRVDFYRSQQNLLAPAAHGSADTHHVDVGAGAAGVSRASLHARTFTLPPSAGRVSSLALSALSPALLVGASQGATVHVLALPSLVTVRTISLASANPASAAQGAVFGPVIHLETMLRPSDLGVTASSSVNALPVRPVATSLGKTVEGTSVDDSIRLKIARQPDVLSEMFSWSDDDDENETSGGERATNGASTGPEQSSEAVNEELARLRSELAEAKDKMAKAIEMNDEVWRFVVKRELLSVKSNNDDASEEVGSSDEDAMLVER